MTTAFLTRKPDSVSCLYYVEGRVNDMSNDKWFCTECGTANSGNFCSECGALRKTDEPVTCTCGFVYTGNFCSNCGAPRPHLRSSVNGNTGPLTDIEKKALIEHGWRDNAGKFNSAPLRLLFSLSGNLWRTKRKVLIKLFQKFAESRGGASGRAPQSAKFSGVQRAPQGVNCRKAARGDALR